MNSTDAHVGLARTHARELLKEMEINEVPVMLKAVITHLQKHHQMSELAAYPVDDFSEKVSGIVVIEGEVATIGYNNNQHRHRQRFTVGHEVGHLLIGSTVCGQESVLTGRDPREIEANQFAAELLMPREELKKDLKKSNLRIPDLAKKYWVSEEAMGWRVRDLLQFV